ncbi:flagellar export chaperone FliS [Lapillicoccus jejuensis]|uniref:Flagellar protein FliS n=1 Tax=Lapillicoccus jejuensis TaxID=402171 RepID=A0A542E4B3_9MICO|nr:flagellar export chaperone FliS [Lapillicoccus jejuensis]TQJ10171.1 flagellar protein FliS [Lapillicoccus jejuensis]
MPVNPLQAYVSASVSTASPQALLLMLCDRMVLDVERAAFALESSDLPATHRHLVHAQAIVSELETSLRPEAMPAGEQLAALYRYVNTLLMRANVAKDPALVAEAHGLVTGIARTWHDAAAVLAGASPLALAATA